MTEDALLSGPLEPTNQWYAVAKIAAIKLSDAYRRQHGCDFISAMPTNLYGPNDNFDLESSHVIPALIAKMAQAKDEGRSEVVLWGTGTPRREFLHVDDCADALVHLMVHFSGEGPINVGTGKDVSIRELAEMIAGMSVQSGTVANNESACRMRAEKWKKGGQTHAEDAGNPNWQPVGHVETKSARKDRKSIA